MTDSGTPQAGISIAVRPMTAADIDQFMAFEDELFGSESWSADSYRDELKDSRYRHYIVAERDGGEIVGWAGLMVIGDTAQILTIGVIPAAQRHGIAQYMLDVMTAEARERGACEIVLEVRVDNSVARRLYERNRFAPLRVRRGYYDLGRVDAVEMKRAL